MMCFKYKSIDGLKANDGRKRKCHANSKHEKVKMALLTSAITNFKTKPKMKEIVQNDQKVSSTKEDIIIVNVYAPMTELQNQDAKNWQN